VHARILKLTTVARNWCLIHNGHEAHEYMFFTQISPFVQQIEALNTCHATHTIAKFWGKVSEIDVLFVDYR
jgi:hypothetical protein